MKKILAIVLGISMLWALSACTKQAVSDQSMMGSADLPYAGDFAPQTETPAFISVYGEKGQYAPPSDRAVDNGSAVLSDMLRDAVSDYGSSVRYRVVVTIFKDGVAVSEELFPAEADRLYEKGYISAVETFFDGNLKHTEFTLHATADELVNFDASEEYGYYLCLYGECHEIDDVPLSQIPVYNASVQYAFPEDE